METAQIARIIDEMGTLLEVRGENAFRCRAYHNAAQALKGLPADLTAMIQDGSLAEVPGIGETMLAKIVELVTTGHLPSYEKLRKETPPGLVALLRVPGLGPKKIKTLHDDLKIETLADLRAAGEAGKIAALKGFGEKTAAKILEGIAFIEAQGDRVLQSKARRLAEPILEAVRSQPGVIRAEVCGSLRRRGETIGDLDILFSSDDPGPDPRRLHRSGPDVVAVLGHGPTKASVRLWEGVQCDLRGVSDAQFPFALHYFTGSKEHNIAMRRRAIDRGLKLNEYALEGAERARRLPRRGRPVPRRSGWSTSRRRCARTGRDRAGRGGRDPELVALEDLTGTFHCHTDWSDGGATLDEMAEAARALGLKYLGIADHSRAAGLRGRADGRARPPAVGGDRRAERVVRQAVPDLQGDRVRHPRRRLARLRRRDPRRVRLRRGQRPLELRPRPRRDDAADRPRGRESRTSRCSATRRAGSCWRATATRSTSTR